MKEFNIYQSPFSWRYGGEEIRHLWSEENKRRLWRKIWLWLAEAQQAFGLVSPNQVEVLREAVGSVDIHQSLAVEAKIKHDLMAEIQIFSSQCPGAGGVIHLGATSMDVKDNAAALQIKRSLELINQKLEKILGRFQELIEQYAETRMMAYTHLQPAEPTTLGYRLALYAQDLLAGYQQLSGLERNIKGKGFTGAVGTSASFADLLGSENLPAFEEMMKAKLGLDFFPAVSQTYPRRQDYLVLSALAGTGAVLYKFAFDLRVLQMPQLGEWSEPFSSGQVGSSAMPFKRNPIQSEKMNSLGRQLAQLPRIAWDNAAHSLLERTLDDSANRRSILPEGFLIMDELLEVGGKILQDMEFFTQGIAQNLENYGAFAATERILMALGKRGADRQVMHERIRKLSLEAWAVIQEGGENPLPELLAADQAITAYLPPEDIRKLMDVSDYVGDAPLRARKIAGAIRDELMQ